MSQHNFRTHKSFKKRVLNFSQDLFKNERIQPQNTPSNIYLISSKISLCVIIIWWYNLLVVLKFSTSDQEALHIELLVCRLHFKGVDAFYCWEKFICFHALALNGTIHWAILCCMTTLCDHHWNLLICVSWVNNLLWIVQQWQNQNWSKSCHHQITSKNIVTVCKMP